MGTAIVLRADYSAIDLRRLAKASKDADQSRRLLALAEIYAGGSRTRAAVLGDVQLQSVRDWVLRFNGGGPAGLIDPMAPGPQPKLNDRQRLADLRQWIWQEFAISLNESNVSRELKALDFVKISARPRHHAQNQFALDDFKKTSPPVWRKSGINSRPTPR